jgi:hypothetical protein
MDFRATAAGVVRRKRAPCPENRLRRVHGWCGHLERTDPLRYLEADVDYMARQCFFIRPAFQAALELGAEDAWQHIEAGIDGRLRSCARPLRQALPGCTDDEIRSLGRSLRRTFFSALFIAR